MVWNMGEGDAYELLTALLAEHWGVEPPAMARRENGKPWFPGRPEIHFNVSHSGSLALCALGDRELGADIEIVRDRTNGLPRYALSDAEYDWYAARGGRWADFYTLWTLKESRAKCTGEGVLRAPVREISVPLLDVGESGDFAGFRFTALGGENWRGAVCERLETS